MGAKLADLNFFAYSQHWNVSAWTACAQDWVMKMRICMLHGVVAQYTVQTRNQEPCDSKGCQTKMTTDDSPPWHER